MATVSKVPRLLNLVAALRSSPTPMTAEELRVRVPGYAADASDETFRRAFERDKDDLRRIGIPIDTVTAQHHEQLVAAYTIRKEAYDLPDPKLTPEELAALHLAATSVRLEGLDEEVAAFRKLGGLGGESGGGAGFGSVPVSDDVTRLFEAVLDHRRVRFDYGGSVRHIEPWRLQYARGRWYVTGYDLDREERRTFRLDRIDGAVTVGEAAVNEIPEEIEGINLGAWEYGEDPPIRGLVRLDPDIATATVTDAPNLEVVSEGDDGSMVVALEIRNRAAARGFLVSLLDRAEVLEPPELRQELIAWLERFGADRHVNEAAS